MSRIIYLLPTQGAIQGGHKVILRHVETLRRLGFDAYVHQGAMHKRPTWLDYSVPFIDPSPLQESDVVVSPDDAPGVLMKLAAARCRVVILAQNPYYFALRGFSSVDAFQPQRRPVFLAVSEPLKRTIERAYPGVETHVVPCFADERLFRPAPEKSFTVAYAPKKRPLEFDIIKEMFRKLHPRHAGLSWLPIDGMREADVAKALAGVSLFLSLSRMESVGMTTLEAMASGCLCAGFTGIGGAQYATPENGFWAADDDCEGAADALAQAADLVVAGPQATTDMLAAGARTADAWSHRRFEEIMAATWDRVAPHCRSKAA